MLVDNFIVVRNLVLVTSAILVRVQPSIMCAYQSGLHIFVIFSPVTNDLIWSGV